MIDADRKRFSAIMHGVAEYYGKPISKASVEIYWRGLSHLTVDDVERGTAAHMQDADSGQYMPKIADILRHVSGNAQTKAMQAFAKVERAIKRVGTWESVVFDDPIIHAVIDDMGGWILLGQCQEKEWPFKAREFEQRYRGYVQTGLTAHPAKLIGLSERANINAGFDVAEPVMIGDANVAALVAKDGASGGSLQFSRGRNVNSLLSLLEKKQ